MADAGAFLCGVIEGFYGRQWSFELRETYATFLARSGLNTYLYCPKGDARLRREWHLEWPEQTFLQLRSLAAAHRRAGILFGVGLSPMELYRHYGESEREQLKRKLGHIDELEAPLLAILFDDMPGDLDALAMRQAEIVADVCHWSRGRRILVCPTYYSFDPALETHFGPMPDGYWRELGESLPPAVDIFWTGNRVCSESIGTGDILAIEAQLGRPVVLWDNYPVNDGEARSKRLYLEPLHDREPELRHRLAGHLCNPMNQGLLSLLALLGLADLYGDSRSSLDWIVDAVGAATWERLQEDRQDFAGPGLEGMGPLRCAELADRYGALPGPAAAEAAAWLRGEYAWDPACLTG